MGLTLKLYRRNNLPSDERLPCLGIRALGESMLRELFLGGLLILFALRIDGELQKSLSWFDAENPAVANEVDA